MTQMAHANPIQPKRCKGTFWAYVPVALLTVMLIGFGVLIAVAVDDPGFAVERDYYNKALSWDDKQEQARVNRALGYHLTLDTAPAPNGVEVRLALENRIKTPLTAAKVRVEAFHNARAGQILKSELSEVSAGGYSASLPIGRPGLWEFRVEVSHAGTRYTETIRRDVVTR